MRKPITRNPMFTLSIAFFVYMVIIGVAFKEDTYEGVVTLISPQTYVSIKDKNIYVLLISSPLKNTFCDKYGYLYQIGHIGSERHIQLYNLINNGVPVTTSFKKNCVDGYAVVDTLINQKTDDKGISNEY